MSQRGVPTAAARAIVAERGAKQRGPRRRALATLAPLGALHEVVERQSDVAARAIWRQGSTPLTAAILPRQALIDTSISAQHTRVHYVTRSGATKRMYVSKTSWADLQHAQELVVTAAR